MTLDTSNPDTLFFLHPLVFLQPRSSVGQVDVVEGTKEQVKKKDKQSTSIS